MLKLSSLSEFTRRCKLVQNATRDRATPNLSDFVVMLGPYSWISDSKEEAIKFRPRQNFSLEFERIKSGQISSAVTAYMTQGLAIVVQEDVQVADGILQMRLSRNSGGTLLINSRPRGVAVAISEERKRGTEVAQYVKLANTVVLKATGMREASLLANSLCPSPNSFPDFQHTPRCLVTTRRTMQYLTGSRGIGVS